MANNSFVKFYRLDEAAYKAQTSKDVNGIYFITDTQELIVKGVNYGMSKTWKDALNGAIATVTWTSPNTIVFTNVAGTAETEVVLPNATKSVAGLMSADDKTALDTLKGDAAGSVKKQVADALNTAKVYTDTQIQGLDVTDTAEAGKYVSAVSETDGKIAVTRVPLPTVAEIKSEGQAIVAVSEDKGVISATSGDIAAAHVTVADAANHFKANTVEAALEELYSQSGAGSKVTLESANGTEGVLKVYTIKQGGNVVGTIDIPKDLVVESGSVVKGNWVDGAFTENASGTGTALKLVIANQTAPVYINTLDLVKDHTAGNGINISDTNVVSVVIDPTSESGLTLSDKGIKLTGIKAATTEVAKDSAASHVTVTKSEGADGHAIYTIGEDDIASAALLGTASDTKDQNTAFGKIAAEAANREAAINNLNANVDSTGGSHVKVNVVESAGKVTTVTITETDIASATLLGTKEDASTVDSAFGRIAKEVADRKAQDDVIEASVGLTADGAHVPTSGHYTSKATTIAGEIAALDAQVYANTGAIGTVKGYTVNGYTINTNPVLNGGDIALTGYSAVTGGAIAGTNTVNQAINILENQLIWHEA